MPPKAKGKAKAKAKGQAGMPRPAAAVIPPRRRRPAAHLRGGEPGGASKKLSEFPVGELQALGTVLFKKAVYYQREIEVVAEVMGVRTEGQQTFVDAKRKMRSFSVLCQPRVTG